MKIKNLFTESVPMLNGLPAIPKVLWYVSAGNDFRSLSFLSSRNREHQLRHHKRELPRPDLFVFNGMGRSTDDLYNILKTERRPVLFQDDSTRIVASHFQELKLKDEVERNLHVSPQNFLFASEYSHRRSTRVYCFKVAVSGEGYSDTQKVLYFEHENIDFFNKIILADYFEVQYLCATREGSRKSIIDYIYNDGEPNYYLDKGFKPDFLILFGEGELFVEAVKGNPYFTYKKDFVWYPFELGERWKDSSVCRLEYRDVEVWRGEM